MQVNVNGVWKKSDPWVNVGGTWKRVDKGFVNVDGTWKEFYSSWKWVTDPSNFISKFKFITPDLYSLPESYSSGVKYALSQNLYGINVDKANAIYLKVTDGGTGSFITVMEDSFVDTAGYTALELRDRFMDDMLSGKLALKLLYNNQEFVFDDTHLTQADANTLTIEPAFASLVYTQFTTGLGTSNIYPRAAWIESN